MRYKDFILGIAERAGLPLIKTEAVTMAVMNTLSEILSQYQRDMLAKQLPGEVKSAFENQIDPDAFGLEEFYDRVSSRAHIGRAEAVSRSRIVAGMMIEALSAEDFDYVREKIPDDFRELFGKKRTDPPSGPQVSSP